MWLLFRTNYRKMTQYNIYVGIGVYDYEYLYTGLFDNQDQAIDEAYEAACENYESYSGMPGIPSYHDCIKKFCNENDCTEDDLDEEDYKTIDEMYSEDRSDWIKYKAVPTYEDDIDEEDLILDYIIVDEDDSSSQADSE